MKKFTTKQFLSFGAMLGIFSILIMMMFIEIPANNKEIFNTTLSTLIGGTIVLAYTYYFGDSDKVGDKDKENGEETGE